MSNKWVFVNGACGYLGSHISAYLKTVTDYSVMMVDPKGKAFPHITKYCDIFADEGFSSDLMLQAIRDYQPEFIIHCVDDPLSQSGLRNPLDVWEINASEVIKLLKVCKNHNISKIIFFSTSDLYAMKDSPLTEDCEISPLTAYSRTKLSIEHVLKDCYIAHGISSVSFRTACIAGNHNMLDLGPLQGSPYLVPQILESIIYGKRMEVYGKDYPTPDGTAIRDYIHVMDVASATLKAMRWLSENHGSHVMNLGTGIGTSVQEMINMSETLFSKNVIYSYSDRRPGDVPIRIVDPSATSSRLGWTPTRGLKDILLDGFKWYDGFFYKSLPFSYTPVTGG